MKFTPVCVAAALLTSVAAAFSPSSRPALLLTSKASLVSQTTAAVQPRSFTSNNGSGSGTQLYMGMFEDFLSGRDKDKRTKENTKYLASLAARVDKINALEPTIEELDDDELESKTAEFKQRLAAGEDLNGPLLEEAFAVVREAAW